MSELGELAPYLLILGALVTASAFFSGTEVAMFSLRRVDREQMTRAGSKAGRLILRLLERPRRLITTLLIGNETVNVSVSAVLAGMAPLMYPGRSDIELGLLATLTALPILLLLGEITPKTVAIKSSVRWSKTVIRPLWLFTVLVTPIRWIVQAIANLVLIPLGGKNWRREQDLSEQEFKNLVDVGSAEGAVDPRERRLIHRVFEFGDKTVDQVMEPRATIFALSSELPLPQLIARVAKHGYSRVPIYRDSIDDVLGIVHVKDLVVLASQKPPGRLVDILHQPMIASSDMRCEALFQELKRRRTHFALIRDGAGRFIGLVTMEDLLEEMFGEIYDEREHQKALPRRPDTQLSQRIRQRTRSGRLVAPQVSESRAARKSAEIPASEEATAGPESASPIASASEWNATDESDEHGGEREKSAGREEGGT